MFKINNKSIANVSILSFILVGILGLGAFFSMPGGALAYKTNGSYTYNQNASNYTDYNGNFLGVIPTIYSISPKSADQNSLDRTVNIHGTNFFSSSVVRFDGQNRATAFVNPRNLVVDLKESDFAKPGFHYITVYNPNYGGNISNEVIFNVVRVYPNGSGGTSVNGNSGSNSGTNGGGANANSNNNANDDGVGLGANVFSSGFMPTTFLGWLALIILIIIITVLFRKLYISEKDKHKPLKHA